MSNLIIFLVMVMGSLVTIWIQVIVKMILDERKWKKEKKKNFNFKL